MKKSSTLFSIFILAFLNNIYLTFAAAEVPPPIEALNKFFSKLAEVFNILISGGVPQTTYAKLLLFILIFAILNLVLLRINLFRDNTFIRGLVAFIVSILGVRFLSPEWIETILLPYGTLFIAISVFLPLIIFFFFIEWTDNPIVRKVGWIVFGVAFLILYIFRWKEIGSVGGWFYIIAFILSILFMVFDGTIQRFLLTARFKRAEVSQIKEQLDLIEAERQEIIEKLRQPNLPIRTKEELRGRLKKLDESARELRKLL